MVEPPDATTSPPPGYFWRVRTGRYPWQIDVQLRKRMWIFSRIVERDRGIAAKFGEETWADVVARDKVFLLERLAERKCCGQMVEG